MPISLLNITINKYLGGSINEHIFYFRCHTGFNIYFLDPDVIVIGGGLSNIERIYTDVPKIWSKWIFSGRAETKILKAMHGDSSGVRGAAWLNKN